MFLLMPFLYGCAEQNGSRSFSGTFDFKNSVFFQSVDEPQSSWLRYPDRAMKNIGSPPITKTAQIRSYKAPTIPSTEELEPAIRDRHATSHFSD